jgi:hypothetical protein
MPPIDAASPVDLADYLALLDSAGLPPDVGALVEKLAAQSAILTLVNINPNQARTVVVQAGAHLVHHERRAVVRCARYFNRPALIGERVNARADGGGGDARYRGDTPQQLVEEESATRGIRILPLGQWHTQRQDAFWRESKRDASHRDDASNHQARADQQHH